jgi:DtxR family transcriptional regulator, Mn-dependent transcriptional regulator
MGISKSLEEYLKTMYVLQKQKGDIRVTDIADKMQCSKASVNKAIKLLAENNLVNYEVYGKIEITEEGYKTARKVLEAHDIVYLFLTELLEIDSEKANIEAEKMKKSMEDNTLNKLAKYTQNTLGMQELECDYDISNERCINCGRRIQSIHFTKRKGKDTK